MACPYFYPLAPAAVDRQPARVPLGVLHDGRCEQGGSADSEACNFGYARGRCAWFPESTEGDAVRFTRLGDRTIYVVEKECVPVRHGDAGELDGALGRQAEVFVKWATS